MCRPSVVAARCGRNLFGLRLRVVGVFRRQRRRAVDHATAVFPGQGLRISAQLRLERFYAEVGFVCVGEPYLEDDMPHVEMLRRG